MDGEQRRRSVQRTRRRGRAHLELLLALPVEQRDRRLLGCGGTLQWRRRRERRTQPPKRPPPCARSAIHARECRRRRWRRRRRRRRVWLVSYRHKAKSATTSVSPSVRSLPRTSGGGGNSRGSPRQPTTTVVGLSLANVDCTDLSSRPPPVASAAGQTAVSLLPCALQYGGGGGHSG
jgi:hypothetical protein